MRWICLLTAGCFLMMVDCSNDQQEEQQSQTNPHAENPHVENPHASINVEEHLKQIAAGLKSSDEKKRISTAKLLASKKVGFGASIVVPELIAALSDQTSAVRGFSAQALANVGTYAKPAIPHLVKLAENDSKGLVRARAILTLDKLHVPEMELFRKALTDESGLTRRAAAKALASLGAKAAIASPQVAVLLKDEQEKVRKAAVIAISKIEPDGDKAVSLITPLLEDKQKGVRIVCLKGIANLGERGVSAVPLLIGALKNDELKFHAAIAVGKIGPGALPAAPALVEILDDDWDVQSVASQALSQIGKGAIPVLRKALTANDASTRSYAATALGDIGEPALSSISDLITATSDKEAIVRRDAILSLGQIGSDTAVVINTLLTALKDKNASVRKNAAKSLGLLSPRQSAVEQALMAALKDADAGARGAAIQALKKIRTDKK